MTIHNFWFIWTDSPSLYTYMYWWNDIEMQRTNVWNKSNFIRCYSDSIALYIRLLSTVCYAAIDDAYSDNPIQWTWPASWCSFVSPRCHIILSIFFSLSLPLTHTFPLSLSLVRTLFHWVKPINVSVSRYHFIFRTTVVLQMCLREWMNFEYVHIEHAPT